MTDLITLAELKLYKGLTKTEQDDSLSFLITSVSAAVKRYCGLSFIDHWTIPLVQLVEVHPSWNTILLSEWPVKDVSLVRGYKDNTYTEITDYYKMPQVDGIMRKPSWNYETVEVTYTGGYDETPEDIKLAVADLVYHYHKEDYKEIRTIGSSTMHNGNNRLQQSRILWPPHIVRILDLYKNG